MRAACAARLFFLTRPIKFLIYGIVLEVPVINAKTPYSQSEDIPPKADMLGTKTDQEVYSFHHQSKPHFAQVFLQGEDTRSKATAEDVATQMRSMQTAEGQSCSPKTSG